MTHARAVALRMLITAAVLTMHPPCLHAADPPMGGIRCGADEFVRTHAGLPRSTRIGLVVNQTSVLASGQSLVDAVIDAGVLRVTAVFSPEHGFLGNAAAGERIADSRHRGIPVYSLHGAVRKPTREMLRSVDVLIYDIQDVGLRYYTYISTLALCMEAAAAEGRRFIVLDRPDPLNGIAIEGPVRDDALKSFVGQLPIPIRYGMTPGELACMIKGRGWIPRAASLALQVVRMVGWKRTMWYSETGCRWIPPSPNIASPDVALLYGGTCLIEGTNISEGRGTRTPFEFIGAPVFDAAAVVQALHAYRLRGVALSVGTERVASSSKAAAPKYAGSALDGIAITVTDRDAFEPVRTGLALLFALQDVMRDTLRITRHCALLLGRPVAGLFIGGAPAHRRLVRHYSDDAARFARQRRPYLLYH